MQATNHLAAIIAPPSMAPRPAAPAAPPPAADSAELRPAFDAFVGETFFGQMLAAMRETVGEPAYFHGGRGEEVFQGQLDQLLAERLAKSTAGQFTGPLFELFALKRS